MLIEYNEPVTHMVGFFLQGMVYCVYTKLHICRGVLVADFSVSWQSN